MEITWLGHSGFLFDINCTRILIDPYMSNCLEFKGFKRLVEFPLSFDELLPDMLICSHDHLDHLDPGTVTQIASLYPKCLIAGPKSCRDHFIRLNIDAQRIRQLSLDNSIEFNNIRIIPVFAAHSEPQATGLVIEAEGKKIYFTADTEYNERLVNEFTKGCDLLLICINGKFGNMSVDEAVKVAKAIKPETALPMHYGLFAENTADPEPFIAECVRAGIHSFEIFPGGEFKL